MNRHLLPEEIDLLLDNEEGFGVAPLRGHLESCASCQASYRELERLVFALEGLSHHHPAPLFAERVMTGVEVYQPWHVAARDFAGGLIPKSSAGRVLAAGAGAGIATAMTAGLMWVGQRADAVLFVGNFGLQKLREAAVSGAVEVAQAIAGPSAAATIQGAGTMGVVATVGAGLVSVAVAAMGVKAVASAARRRRS